MNKIRERGIVDECRFAASRSSGAGGQNVNKVNSKVELRFAVRSSQKLSSREKELILKRLDHRVNGSGEIVLVCQQTRQQKQNKQLVISRLLSLLEGALKVSKIRKATKPPHSSKERRMKDKRIRSLTKANRQVV